MVTAAGTLAASAERIPNSTAVEWGSERWSYRELHQRAQVLAAALRAEGVGKGTCVGISLAHTPEHLALVYGVMLTGGFFVEVQRGWPAGETARYLGSCGAEFLVAHQLRSGLPGVRQLVVDELMVFSGHSKAPSIERTDACVLSNSSGSSGAPKGALHTHEILQRRVQEWVELLSFQADDRIYVAPALNFTGGRHFALAAHAVGATAVLRDERLGPKAFLEEITRRDCTWTYYIPVWLRGLLSAVSARELIFPTLRGLFSCADALRPGEREQFRRVFCPNFCEAYSTSEVGVATFASRQHHEKFEASVGTAAPGAQVQVVDANDDPVKPGEVGEVRYQNLTMPEGYHRNPELSAAKFRGGWFYPGDSGHLNEEGFLFLHGRSDGMVIKAGVLIHPEELEEAARACEGVTDACALAVGEAGAVRLALFAVTGGSKGVVARELRKRLPSLKFPDLLETMSELPRTPVGKVARAELRARARRLLVG